jgi:chloramphenicol 3-O phosphotransferase
MSAIILNGTSSSGKTSIAKAIQKAGREPFIHIALDDFVSMFRWDAINDPDLRRECHLAGISNLHAALPGLLSGRFPGVIDHVFEKDSWFQDCLAGLDPRSVLIVGVHCTLDVLQSREQDRGDRRIGLAERQFSIVHKNRNYDIEVQTDRLTSEECASLILDAYYKKSAQTSSPF